MPLDPRTPVIVGVGQILQKPSDPATAREPVDLMAEALHRAADDSRARGALLQAADSIRVVGQVSWRYVDPGATLAGRLRATPRETVLTTMGGNSPQLLVNDTATAILRGDVQVALVTGAEAVYSRRRARTAGVRLPWTPLEKEAGTGTRLVGDDRPGLHDTEMARGLTQPPEVYPVFENALRHAAGRGLDEHLDWLAGWWSRFSEVAAANPYAWSRAARTAEQLRTPAGDNRMIAFPYTKWMNANIDTDQGAALILCSVDAAKRAGVPDDRWVFPVAAAEAHDHWWVSSRVDLHSSPAIAACGRAALSGAGLDVDGVAHVDLYSCFPSAVQLGAAALGLDVDDPARPLTVTGGLAFAGGPANNYATHSIAAMVDRLRADPDSVGLVTALGWYATKHAIGLYSTRPPAAGFKSFRPQAEVDALPSRPFAADLEGPAIIESYTVLHERDGSPARAIVACQVRGGTRTWALSHDPDLAKAMVVEEFCGRRARLLPGGAIEIA